VAWLNHATNATINSVAVALNNGVYQFTPTVTGNSSAIALLKCQTTGCRFIGPGFPISDRLNVIALPEYRNMECRCIKQEFSRDRQPAFNLCHLSFAVAAAEDSLTLSSRSMKHSCRPVCCPALDIAVWHDHCSLPVKQ
jgi:hypothetical protein